MNNQNIRINNKERSKPTKSLPKQKGQFCSQLPLHPKSKSKINNSQLSGGEHRIKDMKDKKNNGMEKDRANKDNVSDGGRKG